jgi:ribosomal protein L11
MNKNILKRYFNLRINSGSASFETQSIGPNLSPYMNRDKINQFCLEFNNFTVSYYSSNEIELFIRLNLYIDNSYNFIIKGPSFPFLIKLFYNIKKISDLKNMYNINLFILYKLIFIKNYFINKNINKFLLNFFLRLQFKSLYYSLNNIKNKKKFYK